MRSAASLWSRTFLNVSAMTRCVGRGSIFFDGVRVPEAALLGGEGRGFISVMQGFDYSRALIGLQCLAAARASTCADRACAYETWNDGVLRVGQIFPAADFGISATTSTRRIRLYVATRPATKLMSSPGSNPVPGRVTMKAVGSS